MEGTAGGGLPAAGGRGAVGGAWGGACGHGGQGLWVQLAGCVGAGGWGL